MSMGDRFAIPKSISKTAIDSLHAKLSAVDAGWLSSTCSNSSSCCLDGYTQLLEQIHDGIDGPPSRRRRQTPLVNAGYAARMAVMPFLLEEWIDSTISQLEKVEGINVVVLGCGLDAIGLWSRNVLDDAFKKYHGRAGNNQSPRLKVVEVDAWENCMLKQHALERSGILQSRQMFNTEDDNAKESSFCVLVEGTINKATVTDDLSEYHLIAMDFRDICKDSSLLKKALDSTGFDPLQPTIILSELVLAYIGYESTNAILQTMAKDLLCGNERSMFVCLEPMLPTQTGQQHDSTNTKQLLSVKESYARDYANQFLGKLNRGTGSCSGADDDAFHPLGSNLDAIIARFIYFGFSMSNLDAVALRKAVANVPHRLRAKEPFDEHAALSLNLDCYAVVCAFGDRTNDGNLGGLLPWLVQSLHNSSSTIKITAIADSSQDTLVGDLYSRIYAHLYNKYPAIRKMVKSALKTDLLADSTDDSSAIQNRFRAKGGGFWIALDVESSEIVGCVGVRQRKIKECDDEDDEGKPMSGCSVVEYEVQRLAVDETHRGKGIGKRLLNAVYEYSLQQGSVVINDTRTVKKKRKGVSVKLLAVTPEVLVNANNLYNAFGFTKEESFEGGLTMNVYCKTCYKSR